MSSPNARTSAEALTDEQLRWLIQEAERTIGDARFALLRINSQDGTPSPATQHALERCADVWNGVRR